MVDTVFPIHFINKHRNVVDTAGVIMADEMTKTLAEEICHYLRRRVDKYIALVKREYGVYSLHELENSGVMTHDEAKSIHSRLVDMAGLGEMWPYDYADGSDEIGFQIAGYAIPVWTKNFLRKNCP